MTLLRANSKFEPGDRVLLPGVVREVVPTGQDTRVLVVDVGRGEGMTVTVTCGEGVPIDRSLGHTA